MFGEKDWKTRVFLKNMSPALLPLKRGSSIAPEKPRGIEEAWFGTFAIRD